MEVKVLSVIKVLMWTVLFAVSIPLLYRELGGESPLFAFIVTLIPMGWLKYAYEVRGFRAPGYFFRLREWECRRTVQKKSGVLGFGWMLKHSPVRFLNSLVYVKRWPGSPQTVVHHVLAAEACHFYASFLGVPYLVYAWYQRWWPAVAVTSLVQIGGNIYPYFYLRYTRSRLTAIIERSALSHKMAEQVARANAHSRHAACYRNENRNETAESSIE